MDQKTIHEEIENIKKAIEYNRRLLEFIIDTLEIRRKSISNKKEIIRNITGLLQNNPAIKNSPEIINFIQQMDKLFEEGEV